MKRMSRLAPILAATSAVALLVILPSAPSAWLDLDPVGQALAASSGGSTGGVSGGISGGTGGVSGGVSGSIGGSTGGVSGSTSGGTSAGAGASAGSGSRGGGAASGSTAGASPGVGSAASAAGSTGQGDGIGGEDVAARAAVQQSLGGAADPMPVARFTDRYARQCRLYAQHINVGGAPTSAWATVCRSPNGLWALVQ
jgi:hypothetical protein